MFCRAAAVACVAGVVCADPQNYHVGGSEDYSAYEVELIQHHSLVPPFIQDWWQGGIQYWDFGGDTVVTDGYIRLTPDKQSRDGWLWNDEANDIPQWQVVFGFRVHGSRSPGADGIALWYVESPVKRVGEFWGGPTDFNGLALVFDTYDNDGGQDNPSVTLLKVCAAGLKANNGPAIPLRATHTHTHTQNDGKPRTWDTDHDLVHEGLLRCVYQFRNTATNDVCFRIHTLCPRSIFYY